MKWTYFLCLLLLLSIDTGWSVFTNIPGALLHCLCNCGKALHLQPSSQAAITVVDGENMSALSVIKSIKFFKHIYWWWGWSWWWWCGRPPAPGRSGQADKGRSHCTADTRWPCTLCLSSPEYIADFCFYFLFREWMVCHPLLTRGKRSRIWGRRGEDMNLAERNIKG